METEKNFSSTTKLKPTLDYYGNTMKRMQSSGPFKREDILKNFSLDLIENVWSIFSKSILKNYQSGKGTVIPKFGVFTYTNVEVNLEGTTNQHSRDLKARKPVFIVSSEFVEKLRPGIFTLNNGVTYYSQKQNGNVGHVRISYAEMSYSMSLKKEEVTTIMDNTIKLIADSILRGEFRNKEMPGLGTILLRGNILAVKFDESLVENVKFIPQKLNLTKKHVNLFMEVSEKALNGEQGLKGLTEFPNVAKSLQNLRPKTSVVTKITRNGEQWLKDNYDIDLNQLDQEEEKISVYKESSSQNVNNFSSSNINNINVFPNPSISSEEIKNRIINDVKNIHVHKPQKLQELNIPNNLLQSIFFQKNLIISELKSMDKLNTGILKKYEFIHAFSKANVAGLSPTGITEIMNLYTDPKVDSVNYTKVMGSLLKEIKQNLNYNENNEKSGSSSNFNQSSRPQSALSNSGNHTYNIKNLRNSTNQLNSSSIYSRKTELSEVSKEIKVIKLILPKINSKFSTTKDQNISYIEFSNVLREFLVIYPEDKILKILNFIEITNPKAFNIIELNEKLNKCKIMANEISSEEIISAFGKIKDICYSLGGRNFIFKNNLKTSITKEEFINLFKSKVPFTEEILESIFHFIVKTDRDFTLEDYKINFEEIKNNQLNEEFQIKAIKIINDRINKSALRHEEYFNHLLSYKKDQSEITLNQVEFHKAMSSERFNFTAEEIDYLFKVMDLKRDSYIDKEEFCTLTKKVYNTLYKIKDIIKKNELDIEDLMFRLNIEMNNNEKLNFFTFKSKIKMLDSTFDHEFIQSLFNELKSEDNYVDTKTLLREFSVFKKENFRENNNESFKSNFIEHVRGKSNYKDLKSAFQKIDTFNNGLLTKVDFCSIIQKFTSEYKDEDIMKFIRISNLFTSDKVKYPQFLDLLFYNSKNDNYTEILDILVKFFVNECKRDYNELFSKIYNGLGVPKNSNFSDVKNEGIKIEKMSEFISKLNSEITEKFQNLKNLICKIDIDGDGKISLNDLKSTLDRYMNTSFFKYENTSNKLEVNFYPESQLDEEKFKQIVRDIKSAMKLKNITDTGLFNKLDTNRDGFITLPEFCVQIDEIIKLSPGVKDAFFNFLDARSLGMVDMETFLKRFKEFKSGDIIVNNDWNLENKILKEFSKWVRNNLKLTGDELFMVLDFDCDGKISIEDFKKFLIEKLKFSNFEINTNSDYKVERVMQRISLTKNKNIGLADLKDFMSKSRLGENYEEEVKESLRLTYTSSNLKSDTGENNSKDWILEALTRMGLYISENYESIEKFFNEYSTPNSEKIKIEDFKKFLAKEHKCFDGFNLTSDEILTIFSALDPHKKNYLTLEDMKNKLSTFDFYRKMHLDIKGFIKDNFRDGVEVFKYFKNLDINKNTSVKMSSSSVGFGITSLPNNLVKSSSSEDLKNTKLFKKEIFDGINNLFPNKYQTNTILKYLNKKFKINSDDSTASNSPTIPFYEFNYVYFDDIKKNENLFKTSLSTHLNLKNRIVSGKLPNSNTVRNSMMERENNNLQSINEYDQFNQSGNLYQSKSSRAQSANQMAKSFSTGTQSQTKFALVTPFDDDPLEKIKRIIHSSRFDFTSYFKMYELMSENGCINQFEFKNMIKGLNLGLTSLEIDKIIMRAGRSRNGKINVRDFIKFITLE
jgi:Ca2+-binding EF-hand superfamily protein